MPCLVGKYIVIRPSCKATCGPTAQAHHIVPDKYLRYGTRNSGDRIETSAGSAAFPSLDIRSHGDIDTPMRISEENAGIIFTNLADNAMRHESSTLDFTAARHERLLRVKVIDDGEGVSPNNRTQIFDSFFTTRRESGGTGMGLAIVRAMLDAHGGEIRLLETELGTAFELTIPLADDPA